MMTNTKNKRAVVHVTGMQFSRGDATDGEDRIETITPGSFQKIGEYYYIKYEEMQEGFTEATDVLLKVKPGHLEMTKKGLVNVHMVIAAGQSDQTSYTTPFGNFLFGLHGKRVTVAEDEKGLHVSASYRMDANGEYLSDNDICIEALVQR